MTRGSRISEEAIFPLRPVSGKEEEEGSDHFSQPSNTLPFLPSILLFDGFTLRGVGKGPL